MNLRSAFAKAFRKVRKARGLTQEDFDEVSGRTYISTIERQIHSPSLAKIEALATEMKIKPITLLMLANHYTHPRQTIENQIKTLEKDMKKILAEIED